MAQAHTISFESSEGTASGYLARPERRSRDGRPGVVVIQEWWGLVPHIKDVTRRFAEQGYIALAPDLYHGKTTVEAEEAHHLAEGLDWGRAAAEMAGAVSYLREREGTTSVGVIGFCMGGALATIAATGEGVDAYASFYGFPPAGAAPVDEIEEPGVIFFGSEEDNFSVPNAQAFAEQGRVPTQGPWDSAGCWQGVRGGVACHRGRLPAVRGTDDEGKGRLGPLRLAHPHRGPGSTRDRVDPASSGCLMA
jgi:carboxymethylenebutenolidase